MADNTVTNTGSGGDTLATDELTTLNGAGSTIVKAQRVKVGFGDDGDFRDASEAFPLPIHGPTLTKGTQGTTGMSTQALKDAGRVMFSAITPIAGVALVNAEAMVTLDFQRAGAAGGSASTFAVTAGKRLRLLGIMVSIVATGAAVVSARVTLRINPVGAAIITSPGIITVGLSSGPAVAQQGNEQFIPLPDCVEFSGTNQFGLSQIASAAAGQLWVSLVGYEY